MEPKRQASPRPQRDRTGGTGARGGVADGSTALGVRRPLLARGMVGPCPGEQTSRRFAAHGRGRTVRRLVIRQEWWTGDALPDAKVVRRELAGVPKVEVVGLSKEKVEEIFWETITQVRAAPGGYSAEVISIQSRTSWKEKRMAARLRATRAP